MNPVKVLNQAAAMSSVTARSFVTAMIPANGGKLVNRIIQRPSEENLASIDISKEVLVEIEHLAHGSYSPLTGFPCKKEIESIYQTWRLTTGIIFPLPPVFPVSKETAETVKDLANGHKETVKDLANGPKITLNYNHNPVGDLDLIEIIPFEKENYCDNIFKTRDPAHPGVKSILGAGDFLLTGEINLFAGHRCLFHNALTPLEARKLFLERNWKTTVAFSTSNVPHKAHEYLQRCALEISDGLFIQAIDLIGAEGKYPVEIIKESYKILMESSYPRQKALFSTLPYLVRSAGPRSSVLQAVIRQNFGCTHQIFGRDHEGFGHFYGEYESVQALKMFPDLRLIPLLLKGPFYCHSCKQIATENTCSHPQQRVSISGTKIRELLELNQEVPEYLMRAEISALLKIPAK